MFQFQCGAIKGVVGGTDGLAPAVSIPMWCD